MSQFNLAASHCDIHRQPNKMLGADRFGVACAPQ